MYGPIQRLYNKGVDSERSRINENARTAKILFLVSEDLVLINRVYLTKCSDLIMTEISSALSKTIR